MSELFIPNPAPAELAEALFNCEVSTLCKDSCPYRHLRGKGCSGFLMQHSSQAITDLLEQIKALMEENRWIPTSERLPATDDGPFHTDGKLSAVSVLAVIEGAKWAAELYFDGYDFFDIQGDELIPYRVTHWKPMPKGPEVGHE